ncbi:4-hydroxy-tetrahydrodipicolinate reductase [Rathayibacter sp. KR2-224]|uniref:4-hydroxy-tetrahydrodipicolinate reductase n=1 Tax=Rathayibacter sp. KR2-224 TaxID=3400913 RepID=UPI003BFC1BA8
MTIRVAVVGATGKLGSVAVDLIEKAPDLDLVAALGSKSELAEMLGTESQPSDVVLDVTLPAVSPSIVDYALDAGRNVVVGTSGWSAARLAPLAARLRDLPDLGVIVIPNFSLGSALGTAFAASAARYFDSIEIIEAHSSSKIDSPSGTAVRTAELIAEARDERGPVVAPHTDQRARGQQVASVPVHSLRMEGVVAKQSVVLGGPGETLTITHDTTDHTAYAAGILHALRSAPAARGLTVGLDRLLGL